MFETDKVRGMQLSVCLGWRFHKSKPETAIWVRVVDLRAVSGSTRQANKLGCHQRMLWREERDAGA